MRGLWFAKPPGQVPGAVQVALHIGFVLLIAASFLVMVPPIIVREAIDSIDAGTSRSHLAELAGLMIGLAFVEGTVRFVGRTLISGTSRYVEYDIRNDIGAPPA